MEPIRNRQIIACVDGEHTDVVAFDSPVQKEEKALASVVDSCLRTLCGVPDERPFFIESFVAELGYHILRLPFRSPFGSGVNLLALPEVTDDVDFLFTAHYDGPNRHDNAGGVLFLLNLAKDNFREFFGRVAFLFTDKEEVWQAGASDFVKRLKQGASPVKTIGCVVCVDGFGADAEVCLRCCGQEAWKIGDCLLRTDADVFVENGFETFLLYSGERLFPTEYACVDPHVFACWWVEAYELGIRLLFRGLNTRIIR